MISPEDIATAKLPLHCSELWKLVSCPLGAVLKMDSDRAASEYADTGSAVHAAIARYHQSLDEVAAIQDLVSRKGEYPLAKLDYAVEVFQEYAKHDANKIVCETEIPVSYCLNPHPTDPTGQPVHIVGTIDQLRPYSDGLEIWDVKTGKKAPYVYLESAASQMAGYLIGALQIYTKVKIGGIIATNQYMLAKPNPRGAFRYSVMSVEDAYTIMQSVVETVAQLRSGNIRVSPSELCSSHCVGTATCMHELRKIYGLDS